MAIEKRWRGREPSYVLVCDFCGDEAGDFEDFYAAVDNKGDYGYRSVNHGGIWSDVCPDCQEQMDYKRGNSAEDDFSEIARK